MFRYGGPWGMRGSPPNEGERRGIGPLHMPIDMHTIVRQASYVYDMLRSSLATVAAWQSFRVVRDHKIPLESAAEQGGDPYATEGEE
jgi:hypothetical protein